LKVDIKLSYEFDPQTTTLDKGVEVDMNITRSKLFECIPRDDDTQDQIMLITLITAYLKKAEEVFDQQKGTDLFIATLMSIQSFMALYWPDIVEELTQKVEENAKAEAAYSILQSLDPETLPKA
jgi:hypothetical protein